MTAIAITMAPKVIKHWTRSTQSPPGPPPQLSNLLRKRRPGREGFTPLAVRGALRGWELRFPALQAESPCPRGGCAGLNSEAGRPPAGDRRETHARGPRAQEADGTAREAKDEQQLREERGPEDGGEGSIRSKRSCVLTRHASSFVV